MPRASTRAKDHSIPKTDDIFADVADYNELRKRGYQFRCKYCTYVSYTYEALVSAELIRRNHMVPFHKEHCDSKTVKQYDQDQQARKNSAKPQRGYYISRL